MDQLARWQQSVHARALVERGDLSAPTCNDCHGNHGAMPPGVESVTFVCGQCHGREASLFRASAKHEGFVAHNEMFRELDHPIAGRLRDTRPAPRFRETPAEPGGPAPELGQHTREILAEVRGSLSSSGMRTEHE